MPRYLTKSLFTTALECPTRLYYTRKPEYPSVKDEDGFLQSLAEGGMQTESHTESRQMLLVK